MDSTDPLIVGEKDHFASSVFRPEALLREERRQRRLQTVAVPEICTLDPDGDVVRSLKRTGAGRVHEGWACYHTELLAFELDGVGEVGIVGCAVRRARRRTTFRVRLPIARQRRIGGSDKPRSDLRRTSRALRDEGTSYHYLPGSTFAEAPDPSLLERIERAGRLLSEKLHRGSTWTTDAPYRETEAAIARARDFGTLAVEMEAAALYAFSMTSGNPIVCFAHVTNSMA
jgi:hypothetical protein